MVIAHDEKAWLAEAILRNRKQRAATLPKGIFAEHPWDALLHLFVADARSDSLDGSDLAELVGCPRSVMSRWIKYLREEGLVEGTGHGEISNLLVLSAKALAAIEVYLADTQDMAREFLAVRNLRSRDGQRPL